MSQSKKQSLTEVVSNTAVGFIVSYISSFIIFPNYSADKNFFIVLYFTAVSILRSYVIRRWFNKKATKPRAERVTYPDGSDYRLHCFDCEIDMPVKKNENNYFCSNCGLRH
jgi:hypothetical protein